jgi:hypothetical protein
MRSYCAVTVLAAVGLPMRVAAARGSDDPLGVMGSKIRASGTVDVTVFFAVALGLLVAALVFSRLYNYVQTRRAGVGKAATAAGPKLDFRQQAVGLGFKMGEIKNLQKIAGRLSPKSPESLLTQGSGRERLVTDLSKRIRRRDREVSMLNSLLGKLEVAQNGDHQARETVRLETDISVWLVKKPAEEPGEEVDEEAANMEPLAGRLLDLSEGGAAVAIDLALSAGEKIEFWSGDTQIWIPPLAAGVVHVDDGGEGIGPVCHVHFLDPPLAEIRRAMQDIQLVTREGDDGEDDEAPGFGPVDEPEDPPPPAEPEG